MSFDVVLCKYGFLLVKLLSMNMREIIWVVILEYLLEPNPYSDVDDVMGHKSNEIISCGVKKIVLNT